MNKSNQCSLEIADHLSRGEYDWCPEAETRLREQHDRIKELEAHPVKELTDEEIDEISKEVWERPWLEVHRKFARAILRNAQEK